MDFALPIEKKEKASPSTDRLAAVARKAKSDAYVRLLRRPAQPTPKDGSWRWMQCSYTVESGDEAPAPVLRLVGHKA